MCLGTFLLFVVLCFFVALIQFLFFLFFAGRRKKVRRLDYFKNQFETTPIHFLRPYMEEEESSSSSFIHMNERLFRMNRRSLVFFATIHQLHSQPSWDWHEDCDSKNQASLLFLLLGILLAIARSVPVPLLLRERAGAQEEVGKKRRAGSWDAKVGRRVGRGPHASPNRGVGEGDGTPSGTRAWDAACKNRAKRRLPISSVRLQLLQMQYLQKPNFGKPWPMHNFECYRSVFTERKNRRCAAIDAEVMSIPGAPEMIKIKM